MISGYFLKGNKHQQAGQRIRSQNKRVTGDLLVGTELGSGIIRMVLRVTLVSELFVWVRNGSSLTIHDQRVGKFRGGRTGS